MASFFFNIIRGSPNSPSTPNNTSTSSSSASCTSFSNNSSNNDDETHHQGIADYAGVFDCNNMKWSSNLPNSTISSSKQTSASTSTYSPIWNNIKYRNQSGVSSGFMEKHVKIGDLNREYLQTHQDNINNNNNNSNTKTKPLVRIIAVSDTHQFHRSVTLPLGDILLVAGDILLSDRVNVSLISKYYMNDFLDWLAEQPHKVKIFCCGNHDHYLGNLGEEGVKELVATHFKERQRNNKCKKNKKGCDIFFLTADQILDVYGVRIFGNSISFGTSPNRAFQNQSTLDKLKKIPYDNVVDCVRLIDEGMVEVRKNSTSDEDEDTSTSTKSTTRIRNMKFAKPTLPQRADNTRAIDIFMTHSRLVGGAESDKIVQAVNPVLHVVGHEHESHGINLGFVNRSTSWLSNVSNKFSRRSIVASLWSTFSAATGDQQALSVKSVYVDNLIPELNPSIVGELHKWNPSLQPPMVFDVVPMEDEK